MYNIKKSQTQANLPFPRPPSANDVHFSSLRPLSICNKPIQNFPAQLISNQLQQPSRPGTSANAGPHYQKLYARVTHIWGNRKGQPNRSAMKGPHLERTASLITVPPASGKYEIFCGPRQRKNCLTLICLVVTRPRSGQGAALCIVTGCSNVPCLQWRDKRQSRFSFQRRFFFFLS